MPLLNFAKKSLSHIASRPGVYLFQNSRQEILYAGKAKDLKNRLSSYFGKTESKTQILTGQIKTVEIIPVDNEIDALILEANLIKKYQPKFNVNFKDGKNYPFIKISVRDKFPKIFVARKISDDKNLYFGPYPTGSDLAFVLKFLRRTFGYCTCQKPKLSCLYVHLGLCSGKNIKKIIMFLKGQKENVLKLLDKEIKKLSREEKFEEAQKALRQKEKILSFSSWRLPPEEYGENDALLKLRRGELDQLRSLLLKEGVEIPKLSAIEGYDVSHTQGKEAAASLVLFKNAEPDKSGYRRFKIKFTQNRFSDIDMLSETIKRRLTHKGWPLPDLFLIDGGVAQFNTVQNVLKENKINIPVVSLAKRQEHLGINNKEISLPSDSPALRLLQRIRDEAHRFARKYHHLLRQKNLFRT